MSVNLVPYPQKCIEKKGEFVFSKQTRIVIDGAGKEVRAIAEMLAKQLRPPTGFPLKITPGSQSGSKDVIVIRMNTSKGSHGDESYTLKITPGSVTLAASSRAGLLYAVQTFLYLLPEQIRSKWRVPRMDPLPSGCVLPKGWKPQRWFAPCVEIEDWPRFGWRGFLIDCSRHFRSVDTLKWCIDKMVQLKMNRLHLHLSDNHGWRLEILSRPELTKTGAFVEPEPRRRGFYTREDIREIVGYASERNVMVIPEIDIPGHIYAAIASYPELCCTGKPVRNDMSHWHQLDILCAGNDKVFTFLEEVLGEIVELFPGPYIHIGGDEAPKERWKKCPKCRDRIKQEQLRDEEELQGYLVNRAAQFIKSRGKTAIGWEEIAYGNADREIIAQWWRSDMGNVAAVEALRRGHRLIVSRSDFSYFEAWEDQLRTFYAARYFPPDLCWGRQETVVRIDPPEWNMILGAECCMWGEFTPDELLAARLFPAILANAELMWRYPEHRDFEEFKRRVHRVRNHIEGMALLNWGS